MTLVLRPAQPTDAGATGAILAQFQDDTAWMPRLYSGAETIGFCGEMIDRGWVTVAVRGACAIGFIARDEQEVCALYVAGFAQGSGVGRCLLDDAKTRVDRLWLRVFQANTGAQMFYVRAGFDAVVYGGEVGGEVGGAHKHGVDNAENLPEMTYVWQRKGGV